MSAGGDTHQEEPANRRPDTPTLSGALAVAGVLVVFAVVDPFVGIGGGVLVGACWAVLGPVPAFAVGQFVAVGVGPSSLPAFTVVQAALVGLLLGTLPSAVSTTRHVAASGATFGAVGLVSAAAWLWTGSIPVATLVGVLSLMLGVYAIYRYETVTLGPVPG